jgi:hypothetical protein
MTRKHKDQTFADIVSRSREELPNPGERMSNPIESGELVGVDGVIWRLRRTNLEHRLAARMINSATQVVIGESGGLSPKWIDPSTANDLWNTEISDKYVDAADESAKLDWPKQPIYMGYEFSDQAGRKLLFLKEVC